MRAGTTIRRRGFWLLPGLVASTVAFAAPDAALHAADHELAKADAFDFGLTIGTPSLFNLCATKWGFGATPLLLRFSGGFWGTNSWGVQSEVGWAFDREGRMRQYLSLGASWFRFTPAADPFPRFGSSMRELDFLGAGLFYGAHWDDLTFQIGLPVGRYRGVETSGAHVNTIKPAIHLQMGYSFYE